MKKQWLIALVGLTMALAAITGGGFALTGNGTDAPEAGEPSGDQPPIRSDEGIDPNECNWIHNITACGDEVLEPSGDQRTVTSIDDIDPHECNWIHNITACNDTLVIGPEEEGTIEPDFGEDGPYLVPDRDVVCGPDQGIAITSNGQVSCLDLEPTEDDKDSAVSPGMPPVVEPAQ